MRRVGPYTLLGPLGAGGMGTVFRAADDSGRQVALKVARLEDPRRLERFRREAELLARFDHPGILRVHAFGEQEGHAWMATELLEHARPLTSGFAERPLEARVQLVQQAARALGVVHEAGIVHRDVKPENLLLTPDGRVRVTDFGISLAADQDRLTQTGQLVGTVHYFAPEQARGEEVGPQADVWALGVVLYEAISGRYPFQADSVLELFGRIGAGQYVPLRRVAPRVSAALEAVCQRALALLPSDRYADGEALAEALSGIELSGTRLPRALVILPAGGLLAVAGLVLALETDPTGRATPTPSALATPAGAGSSAPDPVDAARLDRLTPSELVEEAWRLLRANRREAAGRAFAAAAAKLPKDPFPRAWFEGAALGDPDCARQCARLLESSTSTADEARALEALLKGSETGRAVAAETYAHLLCDPESPVPLNLVRAMELLRQSGTARAKAKAGSLGRMGVGGLGEQRSLELLREAAAAGEPLANRELAFAELARVGGSFDRERVLHYLRVAAKADDPLASQLLEQERNAAPPSGTLLQRASLGDPMSCLRIAATLREGGVTTRHYLGAYDWIRRVQTRPEGPPISEAYLELARFHEAVLADPAGALAWGERADTGHSLMGRADKVALEALELGVGAYRDLVEGGDPHLTLRLEAPCRAAMVRGSARAALVLGKAYAYAQPPRYEEARRLYTSAAELGFTPAMLQLAKLQRFGLGGPRDLAQGYQWLERSKGKETASRRALVFATHLGEGCPPDPKRALWLARSFVRKYGRSTDQFVLGRLLVASADPAQREEGLTWLKRSNTRIARDTLHRIAVRPEGSRAPFRIVSALEGR